MGRIKFGGGGGAQWQQQQQLLGGRQLRLVQRRGARWRRHAGRTPVPGGGARLRPRQTSKTQSERDNLGMLVWSPNQNLSEAKLDEYIAIAKEKHGYNMEQALWDALWHKHNIENHWLICPTLPPSQMSGLWKIKSCLSKPLVFTGKLFIESNKCFLINL